VQTRFAAMIQVVLILSIASPAGAQTTAATFSLPQTPYSCGCADGTDAFEFVPSADILVTALGWYDHGGDGLILDHPVAIYDAATEVALTPPTTVTTAATFDAATGFRWVTLASPVRLVRGHSYVIAGHAAGNPAYDEYVNDPVGGVSFGPEISFVRYRYELGPALAFPSSLGTTGAADQVFFGPNFQYALPPTVPALSSAGLVLMSLGMILAALLAIPVIQRSF